MFRGATQKVSAVSGRVKKEESDDGRSGYTTGGGERGRGEGKEEMFRANTAAAVSHRGSK